MSDPVQTYEARARQATAVWLRLAEKYGVKCDWVAEEGPSGGAREYLLDAIALAFAEEDLDAADVHDLQEDMRTFFATFGRVMSR